MVPSTRMPSSKKSPPPAMYERHAAAAGKTALADTPVVFVMGPRQSGKTTLAKSLIDDSWEYITLDDPKQLELVRADPSGFIRNLPKEHTVLDEIQRMPELFVIIKQSVDENRKPGRFLLTGSADALLRPRLTDTLLGRMETVRLPPLSECEIQGTEPSFLRKVLAREPPRTREIRVRNHLLRRIVTGCFPEAVRRADRDDAAARWNRQYLNSLLRREVRDFEEVDYPERMVDLLRLVGMQTGQLANFAQLGKKLELNQVTARKYLALLGQLFLAEQLPGWTLSKDRRLIKAPKMHIADTGLACAARTLTEEKLLRQPDTLSLLAKSFVHNELRKQAAQVGGLLSFHHHRDTNGNEVDVVIEDGEEGLFGVKVRATASITKKDLRSVKRFREDAGEHFRFGVLLYDGDHTSCFGDNLFAVPLAALWS